MIAEIVTAGKTDDLRNMAFSLKKDVENLYAVLGAKIGGKAALCIIISDNLVAEKGLNAGQIIREISREIKGGGGGQSFFATAGGKEPGGLKMALEKGIEVFG